MYIQVKENIFNFNRKKIKQSIIVILNLDKIETVRMLENKLKTIKNKFKN